MFSKKANSSVFQFQRFGQHTFDARNKSKFLFINFFQKIFQSQRLRAQKMSRARELFFLDLAELAPPSTSHQDARPADIHYATTPRKFIILQVKFTRF